MKRPFVARKLLTFIVGFAAADALVVYGALSGWWWIAAAAALYAIFFFFAREKTPHTRLILAGAVFGLAWSMFFSLVFLSAADRLDGQTTAFTASVTEDPSPTRYGVKIPVRMDASCGGVDAVVYGDTAPEDLRPGDRIQGSGFFRRTASDGAWDGDLYYRSGGVYLTVSAKGDLTALYRDVPELTLVPARVASLLRDNLEKTVPADARGLLLALVIGDRSRLSDRLRIDLTIDGVYHAVCLSGMHVSLLAGAVLFLFRRRRILTAAAGIPLLWCFVLLSGAAAATVRAALMQSLLLLAPAFEREYDAPTALSAALLVLLLCNPWSIASWGLQLSFVSTAGILSLTPRLYRAMTPNGFRTPAPLRYLAGSLSVTLAATVASQPLIALYFGISSIVAPLANLLILWAVAVCFAGGLLTALLAFLSVPLASFFGAGLAWIARYCAFAAHLMASLPFAAVYRDAPILLFGVQALYFGIVLAILRRTKLQIAAASLAVMALICAGLTALDALPGGATMLNVGQGQCVICRDGGQTVITDCGGSLSDVGELAVRFLLSHGVTKADAVVLTHFDDDHGNGLEQLFQRVRVGSLYVSPAAEDSFQRDRMLAWAEQYGVPVIWVTDVTEIPLGDGKVTVYPPVGNGSDNESGICALYSVRETDFLVTGDLPLDAEKALLERYDLPDLEILAAGHHGSKSSTGEELLSDLRPETVLISVGKNTYGHPALETMRRIAAAGAAAYRTDENGTITIRW